MDTNNVIFVIEREKKCVQRQETSCNRDCGNCDLALPANEVLMAYDCVIEMLEREETERKLKEDTASDK